ncbi:MAG: FAD-binding oxidoreductase [Gammaproteobacteria bacterium]|nr:FAD-binding oxidoreductase [Gammaproteobacteria bacterium]
MNTADLFTRLRAIVGERGLLDHVADRARYEQDFRRQVTGRAAAVVRPADTTQVSQILALCNELRVGVIPHGGNTSYCAGATPDASGQQLVLSLERMNRIRSVDPRDYSLTAEAAACSPASRTRRSAPTGCFR